MKTKYTFFLTLIMLCGSASAGTFETCQQNSTDAISLRTCIDDAHRLARKTLREENNADLALINQHLPERERKVLRRQFYKSQVQHVRYRNKECKKQPAGNQRLGCEADLNTAQVEKLKAIIASME